VRSAITWGIVFTVAVGFALLVDHGQKHFGVPDWFWLALNLTLFLYVLARFVGRPMAEFLDSRRGQIRQQLDAAEQKLAEAEKLRADVAARLARVDDELAELRDRAERDSRAEADAILAQANLDQERFLQRVAEEISRRQDGARQQLAQDTAALTARLTHELLSRELTEADRSRLFDRSLEALRAIQEKV
jgi:F-type H+-transporting ATPase subunit b